MEAAGSCEMSVHLSLHSTTSQNASAHGYQLETLFICLEHMLVCVSLEDIQQVCITVLHVETQSAYHAATASQCLL
jgi:hypothetical protein